MKRQLAIWTAAMYPAQRNQRTWFAFGGCLFWLVIAFAWVAYQTGKLTLWLLGCLAIVIVMGTRDIYRSIRHKHTERKQVAAEPMVTKKGRIK